MTTLVLASWAEQLTHWPAPIFIIGGIIAIVAIVAGTITKVSVARSREQTKRDIAAYVAEGSIDADKGLEMMKAGQSPDDKTA